MHNMFTFNDFIREQNLTELPIKGRRYTWSNMQHNPLLEQLDWFFTSLNWTATFPNTTMTPLGKPVSDHVPCSVAIQTSIPCSKIFRFETYWIAHPGFMDVMSQGWNRPLKYGKSVYNAATSLCRKLKNLRHDLIRWIKIQRITFFLRHQIGTYCFSHSSHTCRSSPGLPTCLHCPRPAALPRPPRRPVLPSTAHHCDATPGHPSNPGDVIFFRQTCPTPHP